MPVSVRKCGEVWVDIWVPADHVKLHVWLARGWPLHALM